MADFQHLAEGLVDIAPDEGRFRVNRQAYMSQAIFDEEIRRVFGKCWLYLGHKSELQKKGDFKARRVGGMDLIFVRDRTDKIGAYFNNCTHRGAKVCREKSGTARNFTCPYHGWVFSLSGDLLTKSTDHGYREDINADGHLNLRAVPRIEEYRGFYFVNYNANAISLYDFLDGAREAIDTLCDQSNSEMVVLPGEHSYTIRANYKLLCENSYDGYHLTSVHASFFDWLEDRAAGNPEALEAIKNSIQTYYDRGATRALGMGHAVLDSEVPTGRPVAQWVPPFGPGVKPEIEAKMAWLKETYGEKKADYMANFQKNLVIFPNLVINDILAATIRVIEPEGPDFMRVTAWAIGPKEESEELRALRLDNFVSFLGPAGFGSPDDIEMLEMCQQSNARSTVEWSEMSKGVEGNDDLLYSVGAPDDERHMQAYWTMWDRVMRGVETLEVTK
jgi:p-cumate 2,3-dioxygenase alpha subunit